MKLLQAIASFPRVSTLLMPGSFVIGLTLCLLTGSPIIGWFTFTGLMLLCMVQEIGIGLVENTAKPATTTE